MTNARITLHPVLTPSMDFFKLAKVCNPKGCYIELDKGLKENILVMKGDPSETKVQLPRENRASSSLQLRHSLAALQVNLNNVDHFGIELTLRQSPGTRMRLVIGTFIREAKQEQSLNGMCTAYLPLIIPRNRWVQVVFHISGIVAYLFCMPPIKSIDTIALTGTARVSRLMTSTDEQTCIDATPDGMALFAVPAYAPPIWKTAAKHNGCSEDNECQSSRNMSSNSGATSATSVEKAAATSWMPPTADSPDHTNKFSHALPPLSTTSSLGVNLIHSSTSMLDTLDAASSTTALDRSTARMEAVIAPKSTSAPPEGSDKHAGTSHRSCPPYIRLVEGSETHGIQPKASSSSSYPRRVCASPRENYTAEAWLEVSGWEEEQDDVISGDKSDAKSATGKKNSKKEGTTDEKSRKMISTRKGRGQSQGKLVAQRSANPTSPSKEDSSAISPAVRRRRRVRRRLQILKANEKKNVKNLVGKSLHASELPIVIDGVSNSSSSLSSEDHIHDPKYGYGFGYLGILRENGEYEVDENADLRMKGALTLLLSDDDQEEE